MNLVHDEIGLVALIERGCKRHRLAARARCPESLAATRDIGPDRSVRQLEYSWSRPIVLLEPHDLGGRELFLEIEDVADVGAAPAVDRLVVVANDRDIA